MRPTRWRRRAPRALALLLMAIAALLTGGVGPASAATLKVCPSGYPYATIPAEFGAHAKDRARCAPVARQSDFP